MRADSDAVGDPPRAGLRTRNALDVMTVTFTSKVRNKESTSLSHETKPVGPQHRETQMEMRRALIARLRKQGICSTCRHHLEAFGRGMLAPSAPRLKVRELSVTVHRDGEGRVGKMRRW